MALHNADKKRFKLRRSATRLATYKILYYHLRYYDTAHGILEKNQCKVDILIPGIMHLPALTDVHITWNGGLPNVPFAVLLLHKLQGWDDHRHMHSEPKKYAKRLVDAQDLQLLLEMREHVEPLEASRPWSDRALFSEEFEALCLPRVRDFITLYPAAREGFRLLGLLT